MFWEKVNFVNVNKKIWKLSPLNTDVCTRTIEEPLFSMFGEKSWCVCVCVYGWVGAIKDYEKAMYNANLNL